MASFTKDPDAILDYLVDWEDWLATGDYIVSAATSVQSGLTLTTQAFTSTQHTIWLSGGTKGTDYTVTSRVWTNDGRKDDRSIRIRVKER
jgi:hypothetical protein